MSKENPTTTPAATTATNPKGTPADASIDLSDEIKRSIEREPNEEVRIGRVFDDRYRCNWWIADTTPGPAYLNTGRISRSKFLKVTKKGEELVIVDLCK